MSALSPVTLHVASTVQLPDAVATVVGIRVDGDCCFHLCGELYLLLANHDGLADGIAECSPVNTSAARKMMELMEGDQWEQLVSEHLHDLPSLFLPRVQGTATEEGQLGKINDFGTFVAKTHFKVVA